ncbi:MAG: hypothetical protein ACO25R_01420 [Burkholderiaceae bacterium]
MSDTLQKMGLPEKELDDETRQRVESLIKEEEGDSNSYKGWLGIALTLVAVGMSLFHLYAAYAIVPAQVLRMTHVTLVLVFVFLTFPIALRFKNRLMVWDIAFAGLAIAAFIYAMLGGDNLPIGTLVHAQLMLSLVQFLFY